MVFFLHVLLTVIATYPMIVHMNKAVIGGGDSAQNMWNLWWVRQAVLQGNGFPFLVGSAIALTSSAWVRRWLFIAGMFFVLCLGPQLHVAGQAILSHLPYEWIIRLPLVGFGRAPSRFAVFLMLALAVVGGLGASALETRYPKAKWLLPLIGILIFGEFLIIPVRLDDRFSTMSPYYWTLRTAEDSAIVLDVPVDLVGAQGLGGDYMLYQTVHQKRIVSGYISRTPRYVLRLWDYPFLKTLRARIYNGHAPYDFDVQTLSQARKELSELDIKYVILHKNALSTEDFDTVRPALITVLNQPEYEDNRIMAWEFHE